MRICFFNRSYWPDLGATGQLLTELAEDLVNDHGWAVTVVAGPALTRVEGTTPAEGAERAERAEAAAPAEGRRFPFRREHRNGVEILRAAATTLRPAGLASRSVNYVSYFASACLAARRLQRPDIVVALTDPPIIGLAALRVARRSGARFVFLCEDIFPEVARLLVGRRSKTVERLLGRASTYLIREADAIVALGETMRARLVDEKGADPDKITVIHNWADCASLTPGPKRNPFSIAHGLSEAFVVMHSGNIGLSQSLATLVDAAEILRSQRDIVFVLVGDGAMRQTLERRAAARGLSNVRFLPYQPREGLQDSFASADLFVVSLKRGLGGYIVPSKTYGILAAGRPYVAAVDEGSEVTQITRAYECGLIAEPENAEELAEKIMMLYKDSGWIRRLGENARRAALDFDRKRQVARYHEVFRELMGESSTS